MSELYVHIALQNERVCCYINKGQAFRPMHIRTNPLVSNNSLPTTSCDSINPICLPQEKQRPVFLLAVPSSSAETLPQ